MGERLGKLARIRRTRALPDVIGAVTETRSGLPIMAFADAQRFEEWLKEQTDDAGGAWIKFAKKASYKLTLSKAEAIDAALCYGWIDGQLNKYDDDHWLVRFTPRKARSRWSQVNKARALELIAEGRMRRPGLNQIEAAKADGRWDRAYAPASSASVPADLELALQAKPDAAHFFSALSRADRYAILYRIESARKPETRARKIAQFIAMLMRRETVHRS